MVYQQGILLLRLPYTSFFSGCLGLARSIFVRVGVLDIFCTSALFCCCSAACCCVLFVECLVQMQCEFQRYSSYFFVCACCALLRSAVFPKTCCCCYCCLLVLLGWLGSAWLRPLYSAYNLHNVKTSSYIR